MTLPLFIGSEIYRGSSYGRDHPLHIPRVSTVMDLCRALGWLPAAQYRTSPRARTAALAAFHDPGYLSALIEAEAKGTLSPALRTRYNLGTLSNPIFPEMFRRPATSAGGALLGAELVAAGGIAHVPGGGTHHGLRDRANGFCYINDPVLAILHLLTLGLRRIAYVDIDAHHCDGVAAAIADDPRVLIASTHEDGRWPFTGAATDQGCGNLWNIPLPRGTNDSGFAMARDDILLPAIAAHRPDALVLQCRADALAEDPLSRLALSNRAYLDLLDALRPLCPRLLVLGGGGYNPWTVARLWSAIWARLNTAEIPDTLPPPAQRILDALEWRRRPARPPANLTRTLLDTPRPGAIDPVLRATIARLRPRLRSQT